MTAGEKLKESNSTKGVDEIPWDNIWDDMLYEKTQVKRVVTR